MLADRENDGIRPRGREGLATTRVLLVDDHPLYRRGTRTLLSTFTDIGVVGEAGTGEEAIRLAEQLQPDVIVMDLQMPGMNGIEATRRITERSPGTGILVTTMFQDDISIRAAIWAGARGYILKDADEDEIVRAVRAVAHGDAIFSSHMVPRLLPHLAAAPRGADLEYHGKSSAPEPGTLDPAVPPGEVRTFLVVGMRGYTRFTQGRGDEAASRLVSRFTGVTKQVVSTRGGQVIELRGDEAVALFSSTRQAVRAALELQECFAVATELNPELPLAAGIGLAAGEAAPVDGGYRGTALELAARLCARAEAGEVLVSETVVTLARVVDGAQYTAAEPVESKGFDQPAAAFRVVSSRTSPGSRTSGIMNRRSFGTRASHLAERALQRRDICLTGHGRA